MISKLILRMVAFDYQESQELTADCDTKYRSLDTAIKNILGNKVLTRQSSTLTQACQFNPVQTANWNNTFILVVALIHSFSASDIPVCIAGQSLRASQQYHFARYSSFIRRKFKFFNGKTFTCHCFGPPHTQTDFIASQTLYQKRVKKAFFFLLATTSSFISLSALSLAQLSTLCTAIRRSVRYSILAHVVDRVYT